MNRLNIRHCLLAGSETIVTKFSRKCKISLGAPEKQDRKKYVKAHLNETKPFMEIFLKVNILKF